MAVLSTLLLPSTKTTENSAKAAINALTTLYLKHRKRVSRTVYLTLLVALLSRIHSAISEQKAASLHKETQHAKSAGLAANDDEARAGAKKRVELNGEFFKNLLRLLRIVVPGWKSRELRLLISHSVFLVARTLISLYVAELDGRLVSSLVRGKGREFLLGVVWWMGVAVPATFTNSMVSSWESPWMFGGRD